MENSVMKDAEQKWRMEESKAKHGKMKASSSTGAIRSRSIPAAVMKHFAAKIISLEPHIKEVYAAEAVARMDRVAEMEANKAKNLIKHGDDIKTRPQREWFASNKDKISAKERYLQKQEEIKAKVGTGIHRMTRKKRRMREEREEFDAMKEEALELYKETGQRSKKIMTDNAQKSSAKAYKIGLQEKHNERESKSLHDEYIEQQEKRKRKSKQSSMKKRKGALPVTHWAMVTYLVTKPWRMLPNRKRRPLLQNRLLNLRSTTLINPLGSTRQRDTTDSNRRANTREENRLTIYSRFNLKYRDV